MGYQDQLFESNNAFLPDEIKGELLYSWCVRFHRLVNNINPILTSKQLFNNSAAGFKHDFPTHLNNLAENTNNYMGTVEDIICSKTILPIFAPFLSSSVFKSIIQEMQKSGYSRIQDYLGLRSAYISTVAPLKACHSCMREDTISSGMAYWHVDHQLPTVRVCPRHGDYLLMATQGFHSRGLNDWFFPSDLPPSCWHDHPDLGVDTISKLRNLCDWSLRLTKHCDWIFDIELLRLTYHLRAKAIGWSSIDGTMNFNKVRLAFRDSYECLENLSGFSFIRETAYEHGGFIRDILLRKGVNKHPLRHILMLEFLFGDPDIFIVEYERTLAASKELRSKDIWADLTDSRAPLKLLVCDAGFPVHVAARQLGIPRIQAINFLKKEGVAFKQSHRVLDQEKEEALIDLLKAGEDRDEIASKLSIRKSFVIDYVAKRPELKNSWRMALQERLIEKQRATFLRFLAANPGLAIKEIRCDPSSSFQWLRHNDADWLKQNLPGIWKISHS